MAPTVLIVDDDPDVRKVLTGVLQTDGFEVVAVADGETALSRVGEIAPRVVILDLKLPGVDGMQTLKQLRTIAPDVPVIILTGYGDVSSAVEAMRLGAYDYLTKPPDHTDSIMMSVRRALERHALGAEIEGLRNRLRERNPLPWLMGPSRALQEVIQQVRQVAESMFTVLVEGETGTGKELVARAIHELSARRARPFVALDCGAIPDTLIESELFGYERGAFTGADRRKDGHFQLAEGGTLFLDEIANLPLITQSKLLRVLQERRVHLLGGKSAVPVNVRIIAASNVPLDGEMQAGRFRHDLYYRLTEFVIVVPPLRERQEDVAYLAKQFVAEASLELRRPALEISEDALDLLRRYRWPGNVRELRNVIRRAVLLSTDLIRPEHLVIAPAAVQGALSTADPGASAARPSLKESADMAAAEAERLAIRAALQAARGNKSEAARLLKTDYKTLHLKMRRYGINPRELPAH
jgi:two-component system nitrogen regulation response regulator GlnG